MKVFDYKKAYYLFLLIRKSEEKIIELYDSEAIFEVKRININSGQQINAGDLLFVVEECGGLSN